MRDDWLDNHQQVYPSFLHKVAMAKIESRILPLVDAIVSVNKVIQSSIQRRYPSSKATFYSIPSGFDPGVFSKNVRPSLEKEEGTLTLLYSGRFYGENQPDVLIRALVTLFKLMPVLKHRIRLAFQGGLEARHHQLFTLMGLSDIIIDLGYVEHDVAVSNLLQADALWVIASHSQNGAQVSTGKVTEYFGSGKPILALAPPNGALATLVSEYGPSYQADPSSDESIQEALTHLFGDLMDGTLKPLNKAYIDTFTIDSMASSFVAVLNRTAQLKKVKDA
jgi:glycosyltransferase involved in cell wall biosynthesis